MRVEHELVVDRSPADVFAYLTDLSNLTEWQSGVLEVTPEGPATGAGARFREVRTFAGRRIASTVEVSEHEPDARFSLRVVEGPLPGLEVRHSLEQSGGGTRIRIVAEGSPGGVFRFAGRVLGTGSSVASALARADRRAAPQERPGSDPGHGASRHDPGQTPAMARTGTSGV